MQAKVEKLVERETEDRMREREEGSWRKVQGRSLTRVEVLDLEKNTSSSKEPKKEQKTNNNNNNCDMKGEDKEMFSTFCHSIGKVASYQGSKNRVRGFKDSVKVLKFAM